LIGNEYLYSLSILDPNKMLKIFEYIELYKWETIFGVKWW